MLPGGLSVGMRPSLGGAAGGGRDALLRAAERAVGEPILSAASEAKTGRQNWGHRQSLPPPAAPPRASHAVGQAARQHGESRRSDHSDRRSGLINSAGRFPP